MNCRMDTALKPRMVLGVLWGVPGGSPFVIKTTGKGQAAIQDTFSPLWATTRTSPSECDGDGDGEGDGTGETDADDDGSIVLVAV